MFLVTSCDRSWAEPGPDWGVRRDDPSLHRATVLLHIHTRRWVRALATEQSHFKRDILLVDIDTVMNTQNSQYRSINIIVKIDACMLIVTSRLSKFVPSPKYCIAVSINIDVEIEELCRAAEPGRMLCSLHSALNMISCLDRGCKMPQEM